MTIGDKIKQLRNSLPEKTSQTKFGEKLGMSRDEVNNLENNRVTPSKAIIKLICSTYYVDESYFADGETDEEVSFGLSDDARLINTVLGNESDFIRAVILGIAKTPGGWEKMKEVFNAINEELQKGNKPED